MTNNKIKKRVLVFSKVKTTRKGNVRKLNNDFGDYEVRTVDCLADFGINIIVNIRNIEEKILRKFIGSRSMRKMMILKNDTDGLPILVDLSK